MLTTHKIGALIEKLYQPYKIELLKICARHVKSSLAQKI